jgi:membrane-associated protease RseP (regulator of RpoE activity)
MGHSSSAEFPEIRLPEEPAPSPRPYVMPPSPRPTPVRRHVLLFVLTFITTTLVGALIYTNFIVGVDPDSTKIPGFPVLLLHGLSFSVGILAILGVHEFGHYFACRYYGIDASLPYFIPFIFIPGTLGAVIRIRQPIATKREFFDVGIAGPLAGFVVIVPVLLIGLSLSNVVTIPADFKGQIFNEPLFFQFFKRLFFGALASNQDINLHPAGWAAWFGLLATALNLCPMGQLDGGHISYAVFGRRSSLITIGVAASLVGLTVYSLFFLYSPSYLLWTILVLGMLFMMGPHHPRVIDEDRPLDMTRLCLAVIAVVILIVSFTPIPVSAVGF